MQKVAFLIGLIVVSRAATLQSGAASIIGQLNDFEMESEYGKQFFGLVQLKLEQGSQVEEVVDLIKQLLDQLRVDQQVDDLEHGQTMAQYNGEIESLQLNLEQMVQDLADTNNLIDVLDRDIGTLNGIVKNLNAQLTILNGKEEDIRANRAQDEIAYNRRSEQSRRVLQALITILETLTEAVFNEKDRQGVTFLQRDTLIKKLQQTLGVSHPITMLVSVTTRFDIPTVERIVEKLEQIRDGVIASQSDDDAHEVEAINNFEAVVAEIEDVRDKLSTDLSNSNQLLARKNNEFVIATRTAAQLEQDIPITQSILEDTQAQAEQYHAAYQVREVERGQEINVITQAYNLLNDQVEAVKHQEKLTNQLNGQ